jgi:hypothetical protein
MRLRLILSNVAVFAVALLVALVIGEIVLRISPSLMSPAVIDRFHPTIREEVSMRIGLTTKSDRVVVESAERADGGPALYLYKPSRDYSFPLDEADIDVGGDDVWATDSRGFCNPAGTDTRPHADIVSIGGSITFCTAVPAEETYIAAIERLTGATAYSLDLPGIGPYEYIEILRRSGLALTPRYVVLNVSEGNDLRDVDRYFAFVNGDAPEFRDKERLGGPFAVSYVLAFLKGAIEKLVKDMGSAARPDFRYTVLVEGVETPMNVTNNDPDELEYARRVESGELSPALYEDALDSFVELARAENFVPIVSYIPSGYTAYADSVTFSDPSIAPALDAYSNLQRQWLADNAARIGYVFIDTTPALQAASQNGPLTYFPANAHLTAAGHEAAAEAVASGLATLTPTN